MAGESGKKEFNIRPNYEWPPERYYNLGVYTMLFNAIANDADTYRPLGINPSNGDQFIDQFILEHLDKLLAPRSESNPYGVSKNGVGVNKSAFRKDFYNLVAENKELSKANHYENGNLTGRLTNQEMTTILNLKKDDAKSHYEANRRNAKGKSGQAPKGDKKASGESGMGAHVEDYMQAVIDQRDKKHNYRRSLRQFFGNLFGTGAGIGATVAGVVAIFSGGLLIPGLLAGIGGLAATSIFGDKAIFKFGETRGYYKDYRDFMNSYGKYRSKDKKKFGFKDIEQRYWEDKAIEDYYKNGWQNKEFHKYATKWVQKKVKQPKVDEHGNPVLDSRGRPVMEEVPARNADGQIIYIKTQGKPIENYREKKKAWDRALRRGALALLEIDSDVQYHNMVDKEDGKYFVKDKDGNYVEGYTYKSLIATMAEAKSTNVNDGRSVQGHTFVAEEELASGHKMSLAEVKKSIKDLKSSADKFKGDNKWKYDELMTKYTDKIVESFQDYIFENAFSSDTVSEARDNMNDPLIKERLEDADIGRSIDSVENMIAFAKLESNDSAVFTTGQYKKVTAGKGASLADQITMSGDSMRQTVTSKMGIAEDSEEYTVANEYIERITAVDNMTEANKVFVEVSGDSRLSKKTKDYLSFMASKKKSLTTYTKEDFAGMSDENKIGNTTIEKAIAELTDTSKADVIRQQIAGMSDPDKQELAYKYLNEQIESIEIKRRAEVSKKAMAKIRVNAYQDFDDRVQEIEKIIAETTTDAKELAKIESNISLQVTDEDLKEYLMFKFKDAVHTAFLKEGRDEKYTIPTLDGSTIKEIMKYMQKVQGNKYLDDWQKNAIISQMEPNLEKAVESYLGGFETQFVNIFDADTINNYIIQGYAQGGLKNYFETNTATSNLIKQKFKAMYALEDVHSSVVYCCGTNLGKFYETSEKQTISEAIMNDTSGDLKKRLRDMNKVSINGTDLHDKTVDYLPIPGGDRKILGGELDKVLAMTDVNARYAALLVFKTRCLAYFKAHIATYIAKTFGTDGKPSVTGWYSQLQNDVLQKWKDSGLFDEIDNALSTCVSHSSFTGNGAYRTIKSLDRSDMGQVIDFMKEQVGRKEKPTAGAAREM